MMEFLGRWLICITAAAILAAVAQALMPEGGVKEVGRLVSALVLVCAVAQPLTQRGLAGVEEWLSSCQIQTARQEEQLRAGQELALKSIIEEKSSAYIVDKAAQMGITCTAQVSCIPGEEQGVWYPDAAHITGVMTQEAEGALGALLQEELGIPRHKQTYDKEE